MQKYVIVLALIFLNSAASQANASETLKFRDGNQAFEMPVPVGYCRPKGHEIDSANAVGASDPNSLMVVFLVRCNSTTINDMKHSIMIRTVRGLLYTDIDRQLILDTLGGHGDSGVNINKINQNISAALGTKVSIGGSLAKLGHDSICAFQGGILISSSYSNYKTTTYRQSGGSCFTSINGRAMAITQTGAGETPADVADLLRKAENIAKSIRTIPMF